jgi:hypothetical protein
LRRAAHPIARRPNDWIARGLYRGSKDIQQLAKARVGATFHTLYITGPRALTSLATGQS